MRVETREKQAFTVIGILGSTDDGADFVRRLWREANARFDEVARLAKRDEKGAIAGVWGAMSDMSMAFKPWEDGFTKGMYLAGVETADDAEPPEGWTKWRVPGFVYACAEATFEEMLEWMRENGMTLAGAAQDYHDPVLNKDYVFMPIRALEK